MKEIFRFIKWQWRKFEFWQKMFIFASFVGGASIGAPPEIRFYMLLFPMIVMLGFLAKWIIWDRTIESWNQYKQERTRLFDIIKNSDK